MHCWWFLSSSTNAQLDPHEAVHVHLHIEFHCAYEEKRQILGVNALPEQVTLDNQMVDYPAQVRRTRSQ
jgi:hypothetical protein